MGLSENVVFLLTINHVWTKARLRDIRAAGFGLREIVLGHVFKIEESRGNQVEG